MPPTNATSSSTTTIFSWCEYLSRTHESVSAWMFVARVKTFMYDSTSRFVGRKTGNRRSLPHEQAHVDTPGDVREQVAEDDRLLLPGEVQLGREAPAEKVDVRLRAGDRLGDGGEVGRAVDEHLDAVPGARLEGRAAREPELVSVEGVLPADLAEPPPMVGRHRALHALAHGVGDRPRGDLQLATEAVVALLAHSPTLAAPSPDCASCPANRGSETHRAIGSARPSRTAGASAIIQTDPAVVLRCDVSIGSGDADPRVPAEQAPSIAHVEARRHEQPVDDWLGDISDDDWGESPTKRTDRRGASPVSRELPSLEGDLRRDRAPDRPTRPVVAGDAHRAVVERRRLVAGVVVVVVLALAVVVAVLLLRGGGQTPVTAVPEPTTTTTAPREDNPSLTPTTPSPSPRSTTPSTGASAFTLPEGTKLRRGEGDPAVIEELQEALVKAGYDPGPADGTYGRRTEAAVVAFQQANGLSADGVVGPETASALNSAVADG